MIAKRQIWNYSDNSKVWAGKYKNSHNLLHWHYDCELLYVETGAIDVFCERCTYTLTSGQAFFIHSGMMHYQRARTPDTVLTVIIFEYALIEQFIQHLQLASPLLSADYRIPQFYAELREVLTRKQPFFRAEAACVTAKFIIELFRREPTVVKTEQDKNVKELKRLLEDVEKRHDEYTFQDAVDYMGMSEAYFSRYFKGATGTTFSQYLGYVRVNAAVKLLQEEPTLPVTEVAVRCGFGTIRNFNRTFKELTGFAPSRLPANYALDDKFSYPSEKSFNPTLYDCVMIESAG